MTGLFLLQHGIAVLTTSFGAGGIAIRLTTGLLLMGIFTGLVMKAERQELGSFPVIGKYLRR
jgi:hypothetical protein